MRCETALNVLSFGRRLLCAVCRPYRCNYIIGSSPTYYDPSHVNYAIAYVHNNRSIVLFFDGHLESFKRGTID